jgi:hypothetical protein
MFSKQLDLREGEFDYRNGLLALSFVKQLIYVDM